MSDRSKGTKDHTNLFDPKNIKHPTSLDELPDELRYKTQAKLDAYLKAF